MGLSNDPPVGSEEETPGHVLCECEALRNAYLGSFFLYPEDVMNRKYRDHQKLGKETGLL